MKNNVASPKFKPTTTMEVADLAGLVRGMPAIAKLVAKIRVDSEEPGFEVTRAIDGNGAAFWHTEFSKDETKPPHQIIIDFPKEVALNSVIITQRQDKNRNGHLGEIEILGADGRNLARGKFDNKDLLLIKLPKDTRTKSLTLKLQAGPGAGFALTWQNMRARMANGICKSKNGNCAATCPTGFPPGMAMASSAGFPTLN